MEVIEWVDCREYDSYHVEEMELLCWFQGILSSPLLVTVIVPPNTPQLKHLTPWTQYATGKMGAKTSEAVCCLV